MTAKEKIRFVSFYADMIFSNGICAYDALPNHPITSTC